MCKLQCPSAGSGMDRGFVAIAEGDKKVVEVSIEHLMERPVSVVEVTRFPHSGVLVARLAEHVATNRILDQQPTMRAVDLEVVGVWVGIGRVVATDETPDRAGGESDGDGHGRVA